MAEVKWSEAARTDLREIHQYISQDSLFYADRMVNRPIDRVDLLERFPFSGRVVPEVDDTHIRELIEGNYRIFYSVLEDQVTILRVHHSAKDLSKK